MLELMILLLKTSYKMCNMLLDDFYVCTHISWCEYYCQFQTQNDEAKQNVCHGHILVCEHLHNNRGRRGRDPWQLDLELPVQLVPITTNVVSSNSAHGEMYSLQYYVIKFVSDLRQVGGFLRFPSSIKLTATI